jgi:RNA polymerase sigma-70 factor (ECF subfamily)
MSRHYAELEASAIRHVDELYAFALHLTREPDAAERLVADTMHRARERWELFRLGTDVRVWLFTVAQSIFVARQRRSDTAERSEGDASESSRDWSAPEAAEDVDPGGGAIESLGDAEIMLVIDALPGDFRSPVILVDLLRFRYAELAEVLGLPERTAKARLLRGRRLLHQALLGYAVATGHLRLPEAPEA